MVLAEEYGVGLTTPSEGDINVEEYKMQFKTELERTTTSGVHLKAAPGKTTTVLGSYSADTKHILPELGNVHTTYFGPREGCFNLLNVQKSCIVQRARKASGKNITNPGWTRRLRGGILLCWRQSRRRRYVFLMTQS